MYHRLVQRLLDFADPESKIKLSEVVSSLHHKCLKHDANKCPIPCHVQNTERRGSFCVFSPGDIDVLPENAVKKVIRLHDRESERAACFYKIVRRLRSYTDNTAFCRLSAMKTYKNSQNTYPAILIKIFISILYNKYFDSLVQIIVNRTDTQTIKVCDIETGIGAVMLENPFVRRNIRLDLTSANDVYREVNFEICLDDASEVNNNLQDIMRDWCSKNELSIGSQAIDIVYDDNMVPSLHLLDISPATITSWLGTLDHTPNNLLKP